MNLWAYSEADYITGSAYRYWDRRKKGKLVAEGEPPNFRRIVSRIVHMRVEQLVPKALFLTVEQSSVVAFRECSLEGKVRIAIPNRRAKESRGVSLHKAQNCTGTEHSPEEPGYQTRAVGGTPKAYATS